MAAMASSLRGARPRLVCSTTPVALIRGRRLGWANAWDWLTILSTISSGIRRLTTLGNTGAVTIQVFPDQVGDQLVGENFLQIFDFLVSEQLIHAGQLAQLIFHENIITNRRKKSACIEAGGILIKLLA